MFSVEKAWHNLFLDGVQIDGDDPKHVKWIFEKSQLRANEFNITGVTYRLTQGTYAAAVEPSSHLSCSCCWYLF